MTAAVLAPARDLRLARAVSAVRRETSLFVLAVAVIALRVIDDNFLQPQSGTSPGDHLVSGLLPLTTLIAAAWAYPRLRGFWRAAMALFLAPLAIAAGIDAAYYTRELGVSAEDVTGWLAIPAGLLLFGLGLTTLWRTRRTEGGLLRRCMRRTLIAAAGVILAVTVVYPMAFAYLTVHIQRAVVPPDRLGIAHEQVSFETGDGLTLKGWYVPSQNGAAVIVFPGRKPQKPARMLARHGYGVLLFDRRGEGQSEGDPNGYGWGGDRDIKAAIAFLQNRPDVKQGRVGGLGLSVGGELILETAAETNALKAVVSEGAGSRAFAEELDRERDLGAVDRAMFLGSAAVKQASLAVFANESPPSHLKDLVGRIAPRPMLLIAAPNSKHGEHLNRDYYAAAAEPKTLWEIPEARHTGGLDARPQEYERRVIGFFDRALRP